MALRGTSPGATREAPGDSRPDALPTCTRAWRVALLLALPGLFYAGMLAQVDGAPTRASATAQCDYAPEGAADSTGYSPALTALSQPSFPGSGFLSSLGYVNVLGGRDITGTRKTVRPQSAFLSSYSADGQTVALFDAAYPVRGDSAAEFRLRARTRVALDFGGRALLQEQVRRLQAAQWIARHYSESYEGEPDKPVDPGIDVVATQLALWRLTDGADTHEVADPDYRARVLSLLRLAEEAAPVADEVPDSGDGRLTAQAFVAGGRISLLVSTATADYSDVSDPLPAESFSVDYPGGSVSGRTDAAGQACLLVPWTTGTVPPPLTVTWERTVPAGSFFSQRAKLDAAGRAILLGQGDRGIRFEDRTHVPKRPFVGVSTTAFVHRTSVALFLRGTLQ